MSYEVLPRLTERQKEDYRPAIEEWLRVLANAHYTLAELAEMLVAAELQAFDEGQQSILAALGGAASEILGSDVAMPLSEMSLRAFLLNFSTRLFEKAASVWRQAKGADSVTAEQRLAYVFHEGD